MKPHSGHQQCDTSKKQDGSWPGPGSRAIREMHKDAVWATYGPLRTAGADWPLGAPGRFPVAWRLIWPAGLFFFIYYYLFFIIFCLPNVPK